MEAEEEWEGETTEILNNSRAKFFSYFASPIYSWINVKQEEWQNASLALP